MKQLGIRKSVLFIVGFCLYITIEVLFRGYSYPAMGIVGGLMLLILDDINSILPWTIDLCVYGFIGSFFATLFELFIGKFLIFINHPQMWDYSNLPLNYQGIICLPFSFGWIFVSLVGVFVADAINYYVFDLQPIPYYNIFGKRILQFKQK